jgi:hypothetical protein
MRLLLIVDEVFDIKERGITVIGRLIDPQHARFYIGDSIEVRRHGSSVVTTSIGGIPIGMIKSGRAEILLNGISKSDVQPGDEVWLRDSRT